MERKVGKLKDVNTSNKSSKPPRIKNLIPVFRIGSYAQAVEFYINWLGFNLDWEWRSAPGQPVIMSISRDDVSIMLNEFDGDQPPGGSYINLYLDGLDALAAEWNQKQPGSAAIKIEPPYDIPTIWLTDPFGNRLAFEQPVSTEEQAAREARKPRMRAYIQQQLNKGGQYPTPDEVVKAVGGPIGMAMDILCEFPEYRH